MLLLTLIASTFQKGSDIIILEGQYALNLDPQKAEWKYISFKVINLRRGEKLEAPGTNAYYLNVLAGDVRKISSINDPHYDWITTNWEGNPIEIPPKG
jgi:5-deoxy-D-glucuronate isomerase